MKKDISHLANLDPDNLALTLEFIFRRTDLETKTPQGKIDYICKNEKISISRLMRVFSMEYPAAQKIINNLLLRGIIKKEETDYKIISKKKLKDYLNQKIS